MTGTEEDCNSFTEIDWRSEEAKGIIRQGRGSYLLSSKFGIHVLGKEGK